MPICVFNRIRRKPKKLHRKYRTANNGLRCNVRVTLSSRPISSRTAKTQGMASCDNVMKAFLQDEDGDTDLHIGIIKTEKDIVMRMINMAPNSDCINICNALSQTPLHLAVSTRQAGIVRRLMTACASMDTRDHHGNTPLHIACQSGMDEIVEILLTPVKYEETSKNKYPVQYHQNIPQDLTLKNYDGHTCLHLAAMVTSLRSLDALLQAGADVNVGDGKSGRSILHYAVDRGNRILLHYLMTCDTINVNAVTYGGLTAVQLASGRDHWDMVNVLVNHGADLDRDDPGD